MLAVIQIREQLQKKTGGKIKNIIAAGRFPGRHHFLRNSLSLVVAAMNSV